MKDLRGKIQDFLTEIIAEETFIVSVSVSPSPKKKKVLIKLDADNGMTIDQCAHYSRQLGKKIEEENWIQDAYTLEVSSPGVDEFLALKRQYKKNIGRKVRIWLKQEDTLEGKLLEANEDFIKVDFKNEEKTFSFEEIEKTKVLVSF